MQHRAGLPVALGLVAAVAFPAAAAPALFATEDIRVPSGDPGIDIFVRHEHAADTSKFGPDRTVVFVHGATYPASTSFALKLGGKSWMDDLAQHGFDVYSVDLPGYGGSTRPPQMEQPPGDNAPLETTEDAVRHYGVVVDYVLKQRGLQKLDAVGWSWGTTIVAEFATKQPQKVSRLVLYAAIWNLRDAGPITASGKIGAYRTVTQEQAKQRWLRGVPEDKSAALIPDGWFDAWQQATWATDPAGLHQTPPVLRAPNGVVQALRDDWGSGKPTYDPAKITVPTLLVQGGWDQDAPLYMSQTLFPLIKNAPWKQYTVIGEGTHTLMMERNRQQLFDVVDAFLTERP